MATDLFWYAVDFDGTLAESVWPDRGIGMPLADNILKLMKVALAGYQIIIHTARPWSDYAAIEAWLLAYNIPFKSIVCGKLLAHRYVDDRAIDAAEESWLT